MLSDNVRVGMAKITANGLVFNDKIYTNAQMIKYQWFEHAANFGEWQCPIGYIESKPEHIVMFDMEDLEVAISIENNIERPDDEILQAYYDGINNLKARLLSSRESENFKS